MTKRYIFGQRPVLEALKTSRVQLVLVQSDIDRRELAELEQKAALAKTAVELRTRAELDALSGGENHQRVVAVVGDYAYIDLQDILQAAQESPRQPLLLIADSVQDPQNLGALVRTAYCMGCHGVVIPRDRAAPVNATVVKTSAGATEHIAIAQVTNIVRAIEECKAAGLWIAGALADDAEPPWRHDFKVPIGLVVGAEGPGIRPLVQKQCDLRVKIPMHGQVASLNVSVAGAMLLYEIDRQRRA